MISIVNQNGDTKLDVTIYFKQQNSIDFYSICTLDSDRNVCYLARYTAKEQCDEVFEQMLDWEEKLNCIYRMPKDEPERYRL